MDLIVHVFLNICEVVSNFGHVFFHAGHFIFDGRDLGTHIFQLGIKVARHFGLHGLNLCSQAFVEGIHAIVDVLLQSIILLRNKVFNGSDETQPLVLLLVLRALHPGINDQGVIFIENIEVFQGEVAFSVKVTPMLVLAVSNTCHDHLVTLRNNSDEEV